MEILRSPLAHARIKSIDVSGAWAIPGVRLVMTGETMAARNLAWMPTLSYDTQAVLPVLRRFHGVVEQHSVKALAHHEERI